MQRSWSGGLAEWFTRVAGTHLSVSFVQLFLQVLSLDAEKKHELNL